MGTLKKYIPFFASAMLMVVVLLAIYPHYQYYVDPDGTAYLTISERYANGDYLRAINGYWSPWSCWLTAGVMRLGLSAIPASVIVNAIGATGFLFISQSFFLRFRIDRLFQWSLCITLALFLCYAIFWQSFDDLWECFFLLAALRLMLLEDFKSKPQWWIVYGVMGALAYFAKAYSFPFFILNTFCCNYFISKGNKAVWWKISVVSIIVMLACSMPWIYALHNKYGIWTTSTAGPLNTSWYLLGHRQWKEGIDLLAPSRYADSPYQWEDPWFSKGDTPHFWNSWRLFGMQLLRLVYNVFKLFISALQLSVFFPVIGIIALLSVRRKKISSLFVGDMRIVILSFLLFPVGYLLVNFESRYIWYMLPPGMVIGVFFFQNNLLRFRVSKKMFAIVFSISFLVVPIWLLATMYHKGGQEHDMAERLAAAHIQGSFTSNTHPGAEVQCIERLAYFSRNQFYTITRADAPQRDLLKEMRRYHVKYYFALQSSAPANFVDEQGKPFREVTQGVVPGLRVYLVNP